jgi:hypothetical protein
MASWEALFTRVPCALAEAFAAGLGTNDTQERLLDLQAKLFFPKSTLAAAELLINVKEATDLKQGKKQECLMWRSSPYSATYPWC